jgi:hypothetical protein
MNTLVPFVAAAPWAGVAWVVWRHRRGLRLTWPRQMAAPALVVVLLAVAARLPFLGAAALGEDCENLVTHGLLGILTSGEVAVNPPLPQLLFGALSNLHPLYGPRSLALLSSALTAGLATLLVHRWTGSRALAVLPGLFLALDGHALEHGIGVRSYSLATTWMLLHLLSLDHDDAWPLTLLTACAMAWTHYLLVPVLLVEGLALRSRYDRATWWRVYGLAAAVTAPLLLAVLGADGSHRIAGGGTLRPVWELLGLGRPQHPLAYLPGPEGTRVLLAGLATLGLGWGVWTRRSHASARALGASAVGLLLAVAVAEQVQVVRTRAVLQLYLPLVWVAMAAAPRPHLAVLALVWLPTSWTQTHTMRTRLAERVEEAATLEAWVRDAPGAVWVQSTAQGCLTFATWRPAPPFWERGSFGEVTIVDGVDDRPGRWVTAKPRGCETRLELKRLTVSDCEPAP